MNDAESDFEMTRHGELVPHKAAIEGKDGEEFEDYIERLGFSRSREHYIGDPRNDYLEWYARASGEGHRYMAVWSDAFRFRIIFVPDWPTLVKLQALVAPIIQLSVTEGRLSEIEAMARKSFRAWHGHSDYAACHECAPDQAKAEDDAAALRAAAKAKPAS